MADRPKVQKAKITDVNKPSKAVTCHFNPDQLSLTKTMEWREETATGGDASQLTFAGGKAEDLTIPLLFDTTDTGQDVRQSYKTLLDLAMVDQSKKDRKTDKGEPSLCKFQWGKFLSFTAVITKITQKFTMFKADGTPVRAEVSVTFKQVEQKPGRQNPTTRSETRKIWVVHEGETLDWIAYQEYGDPAHWRHIAETNSLDNPRDLQPGQVLKLVPLP
jgi:nucleoid-associated protein YgaU